MEEDFAVFEHLTSIEQLEPGGALPEISLVTSSDYSINRAPLRKHAQLTGQDAECSYQGAKSIFKDVQGFSHIEGAIHHIAFVDPFVPADYKLLELEKSVVDEIVRGENELTFRGQITDICVLCTKEKTFCVKEVEASNSFLLFPKLDVDVVNTQGVANQHIQSAAISVTSTYLEVTEASPLFSSRLRDLLKSSVLSLYEAPQKSINAEMKSLTFENLLDEIQMSEKQLREELNKYPTVEHNGFLYVLSEDTQSRILDEVVELCDNSPSSEFGAKHITFDFLRGNLSQNVTNDAINWFLRCYCDTTDSSIYWVNEEKMCRARAVEILQGFLCFVHTKNRLLFACPDNRSKEWTVSEFEKAVDPLLPNGVNFKLDYTKGIAFLTNNIVTGTTIRCLNADDLPSDVLERLQKLFSLQSMWRKEDITPYILDFCSHPSKIEEFLLKHCRVLRKGRNQERFFSLKKV